MSKRIFQLGLPLGDRDRIRKPRRERAFKELQVVAFDTLNGIGETEAGETVDIVDLAGLLLRDEVYLFATDTVGLTAQLKRWYEANTNRPFGYRAYRGKRAVIADPTKERRRIHLQVSVCKVGFPEGKSGRNGTVRARWSTLIDPKSFVENLSEVHPELIPPGDRVSQIMAFGLQIRGWARANGMTVASSPAGFGAQLLRDSRFYPSVTRKIPKSLNARCRPTIPGNYYEVPDASENITRYGILEIDQADSWHYHAEHERFPDPNTTFKYGCISDPERVAKFLETFIGVVWTPEGHVFTNDMVEPPTHIISAVGSHDVHAEGLNLYGKWAREQKGKLPAAPWVKRVLHSTHGLLGCNPTELEVIWSPTVMRQSERTEDDTLLGLPVRVRKFPAETEPVFTNVLHLSMLQSATRRCTRDMGDRLWSAGFQTVHVYSDAIFFTDRRNANMALPPMIPPFRYKGNHRRFVSLNDTSWVSERQSKRPGCPRGNRKPKAGDLAAANARRREVVGAGTKL